MDTQQKLEKIKAKCEEVIKQNQTSGFIPTKDCIAEAMARSTIAAIDGLSELVKWKFHGWEGDQGIIAEAYSQLDSILSAWPEELL